MGRRKDKWEDSGKKEGEDIKEVYREKGDQKTGIEREEMADGERRRVRKNLIDLTICQPL